MSGVIYYLASRATGRVYVGSTTRSPRQRQLEHLHYLRKGEHHSRHLQRVFAKHGEADLMFVVACACPNGQDLLDLEQAHLDAFNGHAMNGGAVSRSILAANAAVRGRVMGEAERRQRSESAKKAIAEGRSKVVGPWSDERKAAHSKRLTGRKMPPVTDATRANISAGLRLSNALRGKTPKAPSADGRTAFIEAELPVWLEMRKEGKSFREIERATGRSRSIVARECGKVAPW